MSNYLNHTKAMEEGNLMKNLATLLLFSTFVTVLISSTAADKITANEAIRDGETIVSAAGNFELGFFPLGSSKNRYLGIRYKRKATGTVAWVANGGNPLTDTSGILKLDANGTMVLTNGINRVLWSSTSLKSLENPVAQILDTGNLVIRDEGDNDPENFIWQSFDKPGNTFLPSMKYGIDLVTGKERYVTSWKSEDDPSPGDYSNKLDRQGYPQLFMRKGSTVVFRTGPWNGLHFSGLQSLKPNPLYTFEFVINQKEIYYKYELVNDSVLTRMVLSPSGILQRFTWIDRNQEWQLYLTAQMDSCDRYALCGAYGTCNINTSPPCVCLQGFRPKHQEEWNVADWRNGCVHRTHLECGNGEGFIRYSGVKLPDTRHSWFDQSINLKECKKECLKNCNCTAYANMNVTDGGSGCLLWFGALIDIRDFTEDGQDLYVKVPASELDSSSVKKLLIIILVPVLLVGTMLLCLCVWFVISKKRKMKTEGKIRSIQEREENGRRDLELPLFDFTTIATATNNFSNNNKLGQGGFGPVYKGILEGGQEIAVKRLSKKSSQGHDEFKNEVSFIAKLQHRNLVKLLGCSIEEEEIMLIYEYMPNKSLNLFLFDKEQNQPLDWPKRCNIINGVARGLLYLHQDSRLRIIHRDLKASNILLDEEMNPKISDFGIARSFGGTEAEGNTTRVVGTYGYMSPEYAVDGVFSTKSDVFSFGVIILEIVSGKKNRGFRHPDHNHNLLGHAWILYKEGKQLELIDGSKVEVRNLSEVFRVIHIGLLCVQQFPEDRPNMASVVLLLSSEIELSEPKEPGFFTQRRLPEPDVSSSSPDTASINQLTVTLLTPR